MAKALTDVALQALEPGPARREIPDGRIGGLYFIIQPSGARSWAVRYRADGKSTKYTLGSYPAISLGQARKLALSALGKLAEGKDPAAAKRAARGAAKAVREGTIAAMIADFQRRHLNRKVSKGWAKEANRLLDRNVLPALGQKRLVDLNRSEIRATFEAIADRSPVIANRAFALFAQACRWAVSHELIAANPCADLERPAKEKSRDRVLSDGELRVVWEAFGRVGYPYGDVGKLLLLTGARRGEVAAATWSEFDLDARLWRLPAERSKNRLANDTPLSDAALAVLARLPRFKGCAYVFTVDGVGPLTGFGSAKERIDRAIAADEGAPQGVAAWVMHDLRRTAATNLQKLGVRLEVTEAILNHVSGTRSGVAGIYGRHAWGPEKRAALEAWGAKLAAIVEGAESESNVVQLATA